MTINLRDRETYIFIPKLFPRAVGANNCEIVLVAKSVKEKQNISKSRRKACLNGTIHSHSGIYVIRERVESLGYPSESSACVCMCTVWGAYLRSLSPYVLSKQTLHNYVLMMNWLHETTMETALRAIVLCYVLKYSIIQSNPLSLALTPISNHKLKWDWGSIGMAPQYAWGYEWKCFSWLHFVLFKCTCYHICQTAWKFLPANVCDMFTEWGLSVWEVGYSLNLN